MPQPSVYDIHYNAPMTDYSVLVTQAPDVNFIADKVFPTQPVNFKSDLYYVYRQKDFLRDEMKERAAGTESQGSGYGFDKADYRCKRFALHHDITDEEVANEDSALDAHMDTTAFLTMKYLIKKEVMFANTFMTTSVWGTDMLGQAYGGGGGASYVNAYWDDETNSTPFEDLRAAILKVQRSVGYRPNTIIMGPETFVAIQNHPDFKDQLKYTSADSITEDIVARYLRVQQVLIPDAVYNEAHEGQTADNEFIFSKSCLVAYVNPRTGLRQPTSGLTLTWTGAPGVGNQGQIMRTIPAPLLQAERMEIEAWWCQKVVTSSMGYFFNNIVE